MNSSLRRLAKDQATLRQLIPPNYLFPEDDDGAGLPDDLTQLTILLTGAQGTPYSQGLWRLHLKMPEDYPKNPPKATFKTRIYHPNVEESTGAVCLDTLKKDWQSTLTLRDVLVTISCLLIHPNPDSALNSTAGSLLQENYEAFARQARLMTSIHAQIPSRLKSAVQDATHRGEEGGVNSEDGTQQRPTASMASSSTSSLVMKKNKSSSRPHPISVQRAQLQELDSRSMEECDEFKENDPSQSPSLVSPPLSSPRKNVLGKRPLSELPTPTDPYENPLESEDADNMTASEKNILAGQMLPSSDEASQPTRKSPKLERPVQELPQETKAEKQYMQNFEDAEASSQIGSQSTEDEKENLNTSETTKPLGVAKKSHSVTRPTLRKVSNVGSSRGKGQARTGIRRL